MVRGEQDHGQMESWLGADIRDMRRGPRLRRQVLDSVRVALREQTAATAAGWGLFVLPPPATALGADVQQLVDETRDALETPQFAAVLGIKVKEEGAPVAPGPDDPPVADDLTAAALEVVRQQLLLQGAMDSGPPDSACPLVMLVPRVCNATNTLFEDHALVQVRRSARPSVRPSVRLL